MRTFTAFIIKEFIESVRTYKLFILIAVLLLLGIMSPFLTRLMPELLKNADLGQGVTLTMPDPVAMDSWIQFFGNVAQMGMITLAIIFSGLTAGEFSRNTLVILLTKGMRRSVVILSKFTAAAFIWSIAYIVSIAAAYAYTAYYFTIGEMNNVFLAFFSQWLFGVLLIALVIFGGVLFKNIYGSLLFAGGSAVAMTLLNLISKVRRFNPVILSGDGVQLMSGAKPSDFVPAVIVCGALASALILASILAFNKKQL